MIFVYNRHGVVKLVSEFASAEALAQSSNVHDAINWGIYFWMPDTQALEGNPPLERLTSARRAYVAKHTADESVLRALAKDPDVYVRWRVANNQKTPIETRNVLHQEGLIGSLNMVAQSQDTLPETLDRLAMEENASVRADVARNTRAYPTTLVRLAIDSDVWVRLYAASNPNTPPMSLDLLSMDIDDGIRYNVAINEATLPSTLSRLSVDKDDGVKMIAKENPNYDPSLETED